MRSDNLLSSPHSTHVSQPLDTCMFKPLKTEWNKATHMFQSKNPRVQITKYNFPRILKEAWENAMLSSNICPGFRNADIYPLDRQLKMMSCSQVIINE